jgi:phosphoribosyl-AMP cyclohydrolase
MLKLDTNGLVPAIIQDAETREVLMLGYMNKESLRLTVESGHVWFFSRSRQKLWHKGETSGNFLQVKSIYKDCDNDTILVLADPVGPVCHLNTRTCFVTEQGGMRGLTSDDTV